MLGCVKKTKSGLIMTARPSGVLSRCTMPKNISLLTIGSKSTLPKAIQFYKGFCEKSLTKCQNLSLFQFQGRKKSQNCVKAAIAFVCTTCKRQLLFALLQLITFACPSAIENILCNNVIVNFCMH